MKVNKEAIEEIKGKALNSLQNFSATALESSLASNSNSTFVEPMMDEDYPAYAYVSYNQLWGNREATHKISIRVAGNGFGIVNKEDARPELLNAIYNCMGKSRVENSKYDIITFRLISGKEDTIPTIDKTSFTFYKGNISTLRPFMPMTAYLPVVVFMAPDGQQWVDETNYMSYVDGQRIVYQCSDGTLTNSYQAFKDWECELAYHPQNPTLPSYPDCQSTLATIGYLELSTDGTVWKDQTLLEEYLHWKEDKNYGVVDGFYVGAYGTCSSFEDYARIYNAAYYVNAGLVREEQFYGAYGYLYENSEKAFDSIDKLNGFQKVKNKE